MDKTSYVYMMGSGSRRALYTGVTAKLFERVFEHRNNLGGYFTSKYKCHRLVYFEEFTNIETAIARKGDQELAAGKEEQARRVNEPGLERSGGRLVYGQTS